MVSSIDENDNLLLEIVGLGRCTTDMLKNSLGVKLDNARSISADSASAYQEFCSKYKLITNYIKSNDIFKINMPIDLNIAYAEYINQS